MTITPDRITTIDHLPGAETVQALGIVVGEAVIGSNIVRDFLSGITDVLGGRSGAVQKSFRAARTAAMDDMIEAAESLGANAIVGVDLDYEVLGEKNGMVLVSISGTAVRVAG